MSRLLGVCCEPAPAHTQPFRVPPSYLLPPSACQRWGCNPSPVIACPDSALLGLATVVHCAPVRSAGDCHHILWLSCLGASWLGVLHSSPRGLELTRKPQHKAGGLSFSTPQNQCVGGLTLLQSSHKEWFLFPVHPLTPSLLCAVLSLLSGLLHLSHSACPCYLQSYPAFFLGSPSIEPFPSFLPLWVFCHRRSLRQTLLFPGL